MIFPSDGVRLMMATRPIDFRKDPFTNAVVVFRAPYAGRLKLLYGDGTGRMMG